ncbi:uncharacterized protein BO66DRAFT_238342 [Aspergillus aculeatinus CBS 121060]|uniref:Uncharacterized protein n=1 Tax=Aspergillus aculeatinus CBS 121060 TaxID=1448322 RepID=A0ACD1HIR7_9EURO|nr:hypothetical protein BO66DRAFT_238342 [Aspergillus aculeatinus CBS 121060]RAH73258.1 hypothetical protein BO66DRAFT_238342 [Aspergillus aculeatinus CBS 121060]
MKRDGNEGKKRRGWKRKEGKRKRRKRGEELKINIAFSGAVFPPTLVGSFFFFSLAFFPFQFSFFSLEGQNGYANRIGPWSICLGLRGKMHQRTGKSLESAVEKSDGKSDIVLV